MLEEDINDDINIYQEEATIRETEKSFYDLLGKELPLSPTLTKFHPPQTYNTTNSGSRNTIGSVSENDVPLYSNSEPLLINEDHISALFIENLPTTQVQMGAEEAMKFLPAAEKLFVGLEPNRIEFPEKPNQKNVSENKEICYETCAKRCVRNEKEPDLSEGRSCKQQAFSSEEPARNENLDQFPLSHGGKYVEEIMSVRESMKQDMKNQSPEHQVHMSKKALGNKETGDGLVNLRSLLISCFEAVSSDDYSRASQLVNQIRKHSSPEGRCDQHLAYYLVDGLEAHLRGMGSYIYHELLPRQRTVTDFLKAFRIYHAICPFMRESFQFSNHTIINVSTKCHKGSYN